LSVVLVTGMSGTGKSAVLAELEGRGHEVVDTDYGEWVDESGPERLWREERIAALLDEHAGGTLFISGCVANQGRFYPRFDAVVLLSAPLEVILERVTTRESNDFGKTDDEREKIVRDLEACRKELSGLTRPRAAAPAAISSAMPESPAVHAAA